MLRCVLAGRLLSESNRWDIDNEMVQLCCAGLCVYQATDNVCACVNHQLQGFDMHNTLLLLLPLLLRRLVSCHEGICCSRIQNIIINKGPSFSRSLQPVTPLSRLHHKATAAVLAMHLKLEMMTGKEDVMVDQV